MDCLCLPKIKKLAKKKEYPVVYEQKQVYQVKLKCGTCVNAQNARAYVQQQRSRIPISTTNSNPPRVKSDLKQTAGSEKPGSSSKVAAKLSNSGNMYMSACDCTVCDCTDCPDPSSKDKKRTPASQAKNDKDCCCKGPCDCQPCVIEDLTRKQVMHRDRMTKTALALNVFVPNLIT